MSVASSRKKVCHTILGDEVSVPRDSPGSSGNIHVPLECNFNFRLLALTFSNLTQHSPYVSTADYKYNGSLQFCYVLLLWHDIPGKAGEVVPEDFLSKSSFCCVFLKGVTDLCCFVRVYLCIKVEVTTRASWLE